MYGTRIAATRSRVQELRERRYQEAGEDLERLASLRERAAERDTMGVPVEELVLSVRRVWVVMQDGHYLGDPSATAIPDWEDASELEWAAWKHAVLKAKDRIDVADGLPWKELAECFYMEWLFIFKSFLASDDLHDFRDFQELERTEQILWEGVVRHQANMMQLEEGDGDIADHEGNWRNWFVERAGITVVPQDPEAPVSEAT